MCRPADVGRGNEGKSGRVDGGIRMVITSCGYGKYLSEMKIQWNSALPAQEARKRVPGIVLVSAAAILRVPPAIPVLTKNCANLAMFRVSIEGERPQMYNN